MIISCNYLNLSLADEHVGDVTIPTQVIKHNQNFLQPIRLKYSNQIKLFRDGQVWLTYIIRILYENSYLPIPIFLI